MLGPLPRTVRRVQVLQPLGVCIRETVGRVPRRHPTVGSLSAYSAEHGPLPYLFRILIGPPVRRLVGLLSVLWRLDSVRLAELGVRLAVH